MRKSRIILSVLILSALLTLLCAGILKVHLLAAKQINEDEFMHLQWSWAMTQGDAPYRDFMMVHTPLPQFVLMPLVSLFHDDTSIIYFSRALFAAFALGSLVFMFLLTRRLYGIGAAWFAVIAATPVGAYAAKSVEVRPDQISALLGMIVLWLLARERPRFFIAGLLSGLAVITNQKFVFMGAFLAAGTFLVLREGFRARFRNLGAYAAGAAIPVVLLFIWLFAIDAMEGFLRDNVHVYLYGGNAGARAGQGLNVMRWPFFGNLIAQNLTFMVAALFGLLLSVGKRKSRKEQTIELPLWFYLAGLIALSLLTLAHELQQTLYLIPVLAIFAGHGAWSLVDRIGKNRSSAVQAGMVAALTLAITLWSFVSTGSYLKDKNREQIRTWKYILQIVPPDEYVMDGHAGMYVYRRNALFYYPSAFREAREIFYSFYDSEADAAESIIDSLKSRKVRLVILEDVFEEVLPARAVEFIKENYRLVEGYAQPLYVNESTD